VFEVSQGFCRGGGGWGGFRPWGGFWGPWGGVAKRFPTFVKKIFF